MNDPSAAPINLLGLPLPKLAELVQSLSHPAYRAKQIAQWLYEKRVMTFGEMTNLPASLREELEEVCTIGRHSPVRTQCSVDGTEKYLFAVERHPSLFVETVYIPDGDRATLCVSSQVGCKMNCSFCHTGQMGFRANLSTADILNQILSVPHVQQLTNIVFMGMGEPLDNYSAVADALEVITAPYGLGWSPGRITVSTIGTKRGLLRFLDEQRAHLAISIHSPFPDERHELMPVEQAFPITEIVETLRRHDFSHQRRLSFEYILFAGTNDSIRHARALISLLRGLDCRVNLIRYHSVPGTPYHSPAPETVQAFCDYLNKHGLRCTVRRSRGEDIDAACGMLSTKKANGDRPC